MTGEVQAIQNATVMDAELSGRLKTDYNAVYKLSEDDLTYCKPGSLYGCQQKKLTEDGPSWNSQWFSLDKYLAGEAEQIRLKAEADKALSAPNDPATHRRLKDKRKLHSDNCSKQTKIREIFGPSSPYHPNQLVSDKHLPPQGLCDQETMYKLACKVSDLDILKKRGKLSMDPFDFLRWRVHLKLQAHGCLAATANGSFVLKGVIRQLCEADSPRNRYHDPVMRKAALWAAKVQGCLAKYGTIKKTHSARMLTERPPKTSFNHKSFEQQSESLIARKAKRRELAKPSFYHGVNSFRQTKSC